MAKKVVLAGACRTAIGKMGGQLSTVKAADLGSIVIKASCRSSRSHHQRSMRFRSELRQYGG